MTNQWRIKGRGPVGLGLLLILGEKKEETTEGRKAGWASKIKPGSLLSSKSGSTTANTLNL